MMNELDKAMAGIGKMVARDTFIKISNLKRFDYGTRYSCDGAQVFSAYELEDKLFLRLVLGRIEFFHTEYYKRLGPHNANIYFDGDSIKNYIMADWKRINTLSPEMQPLEYLVDSAVQSGAYDLVHDPDSKRITEIEDLEKELKDVRENRAK